MIEVLVGQLLERKAALSRRAIDEMYRRPFWSERFGDRGRHHSDEDGNHHVSYLIEALSAREPDVLRRYARWLQPVLTTRGLCTRHLDQNFEHLQAIVKSEVPNSGAAVELLQVAREALVYTEGPGRALQLWAAALSRAVRDRLPDADFEDVDDHLSYLADAAALDRTDLFAAYARFMDGFYGRRSAAGRERKLLLVLSAVFEESPLRESVAAALQQALEVVPA